MEKTKEVDGSQTEVILETNINAILDKLQVCSLPFFPHMFLLHVITVSLPGNLTHF